MEAAVEQTTTIDAATTGGGADFNEDGGPKDITNIAKGKRTKRQRPQSPFLFMISSAMDDDLTYSALSSSGHPTCSATTEDEDTAESLILLSRGQSLDLSTSRKINKEDYDGGFKFTSKKYIQSPASGFAGVFVYECRTCSRTFPSFQALGGHRASHKKPKNNDDIRKPPPYRVVTQNNNPPPPLEFPSRNNPLSLQLNNPVSLIGNPLKPFSKLHECSICGTEFNSGQALGGHMRRHRVAGGGNRGGNTNYHTNNNPNVTIMTPFSPVEAYDQKSKDDSLSLSLDLNLPAPRETTAATAEDVQHRKRSFAFTPAEENGTKQQPAVHLSPSPTLVDCHY